MEEQTKNESKSYQNNFVRNTLITALSVFALSSFIILLYMSSKNEWREKVQLFQSQNDSLQRFQVLLQTRLLKRALEDSIKQKIVYDTYFDPRVENNFRMYGLFKDRKGAYSTQTLARRFNISNEKSIKLSEADGEKWYIIPVKGVHFVEKGENLQSITVNYYSNRADSVLIKEFNGEIKSGTFIFIPYNY